MGLSSSNFSQSELSPSEIADQYCAGNSFIRQLLQAGSERVTLREGQALFRQGDPGDSMYLLLQGRLAVRLEHEDGTETDLVELNPGSPVGEIALLTGQPRTASVYAVTDAELVRCLRANYERIEQKNSNELAEFTRTVTRRLREVQLTNVLAAFFGVQDSQLLAWLRDEMEWIRLDHGEVLFREGDPGQVMYIVISGRLRITTSSPDQVQRVVGEVSPGEIVGELGLLSGELRSATAVAIRETHVARMTQPVFEQLAGRCPEATMRLARLVIKRQQSTLKTSPSKPVRALSLALVPCNRDVPLVEFANELAGCLGTYGRVLTLDSARLDSALGKPGTSQVAPDHPTGLVISTWLNEQESHNHFLLYVADPEWSPWTERCICQADRLLLLGEADANPEPGHVEQIISQRHMPVRQELILLHSKSTHQPSGTARWLVERDLHTHHHVRQDDQSHMKRLARRLAGKALGVVLSGGGARGFAHLGVLRAMEEQGIEIDLVGGTSMGSLVGGQYSISRGVEEGLELAERFANPKRLFDYTVPLTSLMASKKVTQVIQEVLGDISIEDLWRPFFCVSSNLTRAETAVHRQGCLWKAVRASIAIPGIFTPILLDKDVLVDGGAMNNFPVDIMFELCEGGPVIGSNVSPSLERRRSYEFGPSINGWKVLWSRINPFSPAMRVPSLLGSLMRAQEIRGVSSLRLSESLANLVIRPDTSSFNIMDFASYKPIIEIGYKAAQEQLAGWSVPNQA